MEQISVINFKSVNRDNYDSLIKAKADEHPEISKVSWVWLGDDTVWGYNMGPEHFGLLSDSQIIGPLIPQDVSDYEIPSTIPQFVTDVDENDEIIQIQLFEITNYFIEGV